MKATITEIQARLSVRENKQSGIQNYDIDNAYPQRIRNAVKASGRAMQCTQVLGRFVRGTGFADPFYKTLVNDKGLTVDKLHRKLVTDYLLYRGFAIHFNYDLNGKITEMNHIPFEELRLSIPNENGDVAKVKHHPDWAKEFGRNFKKELITEYDLFNPEINVIISQANQAGGFGSYKGQVYWYSANGTKYPEGWCDSVLEDVISDSEAKQFRLNNLSTNFLASHILEINELETDEARESFNNVLNTFQGAKNSSRILVLEKKGTEQTFDLKKVDIQDSDGLFEKTESSVLESIRRVYMVVPVLLGDLIAGKLATSSEIQDAYAFTNSITQDERMIFEEVFMQIFKYWHDPTANPSANYVINPINYLTTPVATDPVVTPMPNA